MQPLFKLLNHPVAVPKILKWDQVFTERIPLKCQAHLGNPLLVSILIINNQQSLIIKFRTNLKLQEMDKLLRIDSHNTLWTEATEEIQVITMQLLLRPILDQEFFTQESRKLQFLRRLRYELRVKKLMRQLWVTVKWTVILLQINLDIPNLHLLEKAVL